MKHQGKQRHGLWLALLLALPACMTAPQPPQKVAQVVQGARRAHEALTPHPQLPAYETAAERKVLGKFDANDDYRIAHKEWYAQTLPPEPGKFRNMAEWETMQEVWTTYSPGTSQTVAVRRMMAEQTIQFVRFSNPPVLARVVVAAQGDQDDFVAALKQYGMTAQELTKVSFLTLPNDAIWHIDYGAWPLVDKQNGHLAITDFVYYANRIHDDAIPTRLSQTAYPQATVYRMPFNFEGGNIQADGQGTCATSLRAMANTGYSVQKVKNLLKKYAQCDNLVVMKDITDDGTGHIDMFFKWLSIDSVLIGRYETQMTLDYNGDGVAETLAMPDTQSASYAATYATNKQRMDDNAALWAGLTAPNGKPYKVYRLSMMTHFEDSQGALPRTFINSTFINGVNVYPAYATSSCRDPAGAACMQDSECAAGDHCASAKCTFGPTTQGCDELVTCAAGQQCAPDPLKVALAAQVQAQWQAALPTWKHVGLRADTIALWSGAIHCITRTIPVGSFAKAIPDGTCVGGTCGCVDGGMGESCSASSQCVGPKWMCECDVCKGTCASGGASCTDDADCSTDGKTIIAGACQVDAGQGCYGQAATPPATGDVCQGVSFEGSCSGNQLQYCDSGLKSSTCAGCCAWDTANGYYNCLTGTPCSGCNSECPTLGAGGCSSQGTHAWTCVSVAGCNKRSYAACAAGCDAGTGTCKAGSGAQSCPGTGADAGSTDAATAVDAAPAPDAAPAADAAPVADAAVADDAAAGADAVAADASADIDCVANCYGKVCGPNGCGGICGSCPGGTFCNPIGTCAVIDQADIQASDAAIAPKPDAASEADVAAPTDAATVADVAAGADAAGVPDTSAVLLDAKTADAGAYYLGGSTPRASCDAGRGGGARAWGWLALLGIGALVGVRRRRA